MVRRGSAVRVRQRALSLKNYLQFSRLCCLASIAEHLQMSEGFSESHGVDDEERLNRARLPVIASRAARDC
jgi:hypothetical protein